LPDASSRASDAAARFGGVRVEVAGQGHHAPVEQALGQPVLARLGDSQL